MKLKTVGIRLDSSHMDSAFLLLRERVWLFPKTYGDKVAIVDSNLDKYMRAYWQSFAVIQIHEDQE
ncbi:hypothetical protein PanWU01x14_248790 [Parasponia andersonii]|uniref:Uncharacterized protein n=1 Tax=Parasponia andersonii TaxID=3476 RepID=A0A2P5BDB8_PARAD|nr:hypothetical protein PanWU01x14_248790 [Parasponia andersonii]